MLILIGSEKALNGKQHPFIIKGLAKVSTEGRHLKVMKPTYDKHTVNTVLKGDKRKAFLELWDKVRTPSLTICVQHTTGSPSHSNQARKKGFNLGQEGGKTVPVCR